MEMVKKDKRNLTSGIVPIDEIPDTSIPPLDQSTGGLTATQLEAISFPPIRWVVKDILPPGITVLAGPPKVGKTRLMTHIMASVVTERRVFNKIETEKADALFLCLEDDEWEDVQERMMEFLPEGWPDNLILHKDWPRIGQGGVRKLEAHLQKFPKTRLVVIDVLECIRNPKRTPSQSIFTYDYNTIAAFKPLLEKRNLAIVILHHTNKNEDARDVFTRISGTNGIAAAANTLMILTREERLGTTMLLSIEGRKALADELALEYDAINGGWELLGEARSFETSERRKQILDFLRAKKPEAQSPKEIAEGIGGNPSTLRTLLRKMLRTDQVVQPTLGKYTVEDLGWG
jgi:hypothetical protein